MRALVFVHGGAGYHDLPKYKEIKRSLTLACNKGLSVLDIPRQAVDGVAEAISVLEDDPILNAGFGSNLTIDGEVECDASIMDGLTGSFGAVASVPGIKNPICLAKSILNYSCMSDPLGRIPPLTLAGNGALKFAEKANDIQCCSPSSMISPHARHQWEKWKSRLEDAAIGTVDGRVNRDDLNNQQDTVGAIVVTQDGGISAGVSSGGLLLKLPGRIGEAAMYGAGCWAESRQGISVACSVSGIGEHIIRQNLACVSATRVIEGLLADKATQLDGEDAHQLDEVRQVGQEDDMSTTSSESGSNDGFDEHACLEEMMNQFAQNVPPGVDPNVGLIMVVHEAPSPPRLWCAFTTHSMAVAYASAGSYTVQASILQQASQAARPNTSKKHSIFITSFRVPSD